MPLDAIVRSRALAPVRRAGLELARRWPWPVRTRIATGRRMYVDLRSAVSRGIFVKGEFDPMVFQPIRAALSDGGTFLDVGSNVGFYSMLALDVVGPSGSVHAFEIDARPLRCLRRTIASEQLTNLHVHAVAVGDRDGKVGVHMDADSGLTGVVQSASAPQVMMTTLDAWWRASGASRIQAIKMDIEGAEWLALRGAADLLRAERPLIVCESDETLQQRFGHGPAQLQEYLAGLGYRIDPLAGAWSETIVATPTLT